MNAISFFSLLIMTVGIILTILNRKKPHKFVTWSVALCTILHFFSYALFSTIMANTLAFGFILIGLIIGGTFGFFVKFTKKDKDIYYNQKTTFTLIYLSFLYLNQLMAVFLNAYITFMIFIAAISLGLYLGMNIILLVRSKKIRRIPAFALIVGIVIFGLSRFGIYAEIVGYNYDAALSAYARDTEESSNEVYENIQTDVGLKTKSIHTIEWIRYPYIEDGKVWLSYKIWAEEYYANDTVWYNSEIGDLQNYPAGTPVKYVSYEYNVDAPGWAITVGELESKYPEYGTAIEETPIIDTEENIEQIEIDNNDEEAIINEEPIINDEAIINEEPIISDEIELDNVNEEIVFIQFVEQSTANAAVIVSGFLSSVGALLGALMGLPKGMAPMSNYGYTNKDIPKLINQINAKESANSIKPLNTVNPQQSNIKPGTRRSDGKIYTKNSGWVNEYTTELQINSNNSSIDYFRNKIEHYKATGDKNNLAAAEDTLKNIQRKNRYLNEDMNAIKTARIKEEMKFNDESATKHAIRSYYLDAGYDTSKGISFASDIGLAIGTAGTSTALGSAKTVLSVLTTAKEITDTSADAYEAFRGGKTVVQFVSEQTAKRIVGKAIGTEFDKGKLLYGIEESKNTFLKVLASTVETSSNYIVNELADKSGIYENFGKGMDDITTGGKKK